MIAIIVSMLTIIYVFVTWISEYKLSKKRDFSNLTAEDKEIFAEQIKYHNEKIYQDFALFIQITTAVIVGIGYI
jgi:hypothetical protein